MGPVAPWPELLWHTPSPEPGENPIGGAFGNSPFNMSVEISCVVSALCLKVLLFSFYFQVWYETGRKHSVWKRRCGWGNYMYCAFLSLSTACPLLVSHGIDSKYPSTNHSYLSGIVVPISVLLMPFTEAAKLVCGASRSCLALIKLPKTCHLPAQLCFLRDRCSL